MANPFIGEIQITPYNFAPLGWAACNGQILQIAQNTAVFSLLGTMYGGDGISTFALPNLEGQVPMGQGNGAGLTPRVLGESGGEPTVTLLETEIPGHTHTLMANAATGTTGSPTGNMISEPPSNPRDPSALYAASAANTGMLNNGVLATGGSQPHNNLQPYLVLNFVIAISGVYPSRG